MLKQVYWALKLGGPMAIFEWLFLDLFGFSLVTQPMLQRRPVLRSIDSYIQISCRFQKSKQKG